jgi:tRNA threonylcarbamoyladenosine biosynthesis protein TsaB
MDHILNIDTATEEAQISMASDGIVVGAAVNRSAKDHAAFLQPAILRLSKETNIPLAELSAIAITAGPGSYTGLRVGLSSAKGLCYALNKPLITLNTLHALAASAAMEANKHGLKTESLLCPMIDARRMEVFTAVYNMQLEVIAAPCAMILQEGSFEAFNKNEMNFFGTGAEKCLSIFKNPK